MDPGYRKKLSLMFKGVAVVQDHDQYSTDLMKCVEELVQKELKEDTQVRLLCIVNKASLALKLHTTVRHRDLGWSVWSPRPDDTHALVPTQAA